MAKKISSDDWFAALAATLKGEASRTVRATAVRGLLQTLETRYPGKAVELRVPPFGAVQCMEGGAHTRGTPPNVVEMDTDTFLDLALGLRDWSELRAEGKITASGTRSEIAELFPVLATREIEQIQKNHQAE